MSALFGALFALCSPPTDLVPLVWIGLAGLAFACSVELPARSPRAEWLAGGLRGLAWGFGANLVALRFVPAVIARFTPLPYAAEVLALILLALAQGLAWAVAAIVRGVLVRARVPRSIAFAVAVYVATFVPCVFPWTPAGGVTIWPALMQLADVIGERGVAFLIALGAGLLAEGVRVSRIPREKRLAGILVGAGVVLPFAMAAYGALRMDAIDDLRERAPHTDVGLVEPSIPATTRWDAAAAPSIAEGLHRLTLRSELDAATMTVWPESAYPYVLPHGITREPLGDQTMHRHGVIGPLLVGAVTQAPNGDHYNAALAVASDGRILGEYDKLHLLWFGEEVPLAGAFPWMRRTFARGLGMVPGTAQVRLDVTLHVHAAVMICYEDTISEAGREAGLVDPNLLVNLSNDGWFVGSQESVLHMRVSALRAVEERRDFVRAVNLGPTGLIDAAGRIAKRYDPVAPGALVANVALLEGRTPFCWAGDWPGIFLCVALGVLVWLRLRGRPAKEGSRSSTPPKPARS